MRGENANPPMPWQWVIGKWTGDLASSVINHANAGITYFSLDQGRQGNQPYIMAAFRRVKDSPVPEHLSIADEHIARKLDRRLEERHPYLRDQP